MGRVHLLRLAVASLVTGALALRQTLSPFQQREGYPELHDQWGKSHSDAPLALQFLYTSSALDGTRRHGKCTATCNGESVDVDEAEDECWGLFKLSCAWSHKGAAGFAGAKCEGHWARFEDGGNRTRMALCEGAFKHYHVMDRSYDGKEVHVASVSACAGTEFVTMRQHDPTDSSDSGVLMGSVPLHTDLPYGTLLDEEWVEVEEDAQHAFDGAADATHGLGRWHPRVEERCDGMSFKVKSFKPRGGQQASGMADAEAFADDVAASARPASFSNVGPPIYPMPPPASPPLAPGALPAQQRHTPHAACNMTCNERAALWHGALPCVGQADVSCSWNDTDANVAPDRREISPLQLSTSSALFAAAQDAPAAGVGSHDGGCLRASCKGVFSGRWLGNKCWGVSQAVVATDTFVKVDICTKKRGVMGGRCRGGGVVMGDYCDGKRLTAMRYEHEREDGSGGGGRVASL